MRRLILTLAWLYCSQTLVVAAPAPLTLEECIERGLAQSVRVRMAELSVGEAEEGVKEAWGAFLPTLTVDYGQTQLDNTGGQTRDTDYLDQENESFSVRLSQPIFSGMAGVSGVKRAGYSREYRVYEFKLNQLQMIRDIRINFYDLLRAESLVEKWRESISRLENQEKIARAWVEQELAPRLRLLEVAAELSYARQSLAEAETAQVSAETRLKEWLAYPQGLPFAITGDLQASGPARCQTVADCTEEAFLRRPELTLAEMNINMAREDTKAIVARNLPRVTFDASWVAYERDYANSVLQDEERDYYSLALNVNMRPFQGGRNIFAYRRQKLAVERYQLEYLNRRNGIMTEVEIRFQEVQQGDSRLNNSVKGLEQASEAYAFASKSAKLGVSSLNDLLDAEIRLIQAEINKVNAEHAQQHSMVGLDFAVGSIWPGAEALP